LFFRLADRSPALAAARLVLVITAVAAPLGIHVRKHLKPRRFDVAGSGSDPANTSPHSLGAPVTATSIRQLTWNGAQQQTLWRTP
jgi:hypothetical protein